MKLVGRNIRKFRQQRGLSLRDIAKRINVSASFISQVETGKISPSLSKLKDIADVLNTTVGYIIGESQQSSQSIVVKEKTRKHVDQIGDGISIFLLSSSDQNYQMEPLLIKMDKKASSGEQPYQHFGQEFVLVLKGKCEITLSNKKYILNKGDSIYFNSNIPHSFRNMIDRETEALWVVTPPSF